METTVTIYSTPTCHFCKEAKEFLTTNGVAFEDVDVASDATRKEEMIELTGQMGVPVIRIGNDVIVGYDESQLKSILSQESLLKN